MNTSKLDARSARSRSALINRAVPAVGRLSRDELTVSDHKEDALVFNRHHFLGLAIGSALLPSLAAARTTPSASERPQEIGPENQALAKFAGHWDVTETVWAAPGAAPITTTGLVADRRMIGSFLQEILHSASDRSGNSVKRIDYLSFNRVEGRWDYVSMDMRAPVGIMSAWSFERDPAERILLTFQPFAVAGAETAVAGQMLRMDEVIARQGSDHNTKDQHFILADATGTKWLAHRYASARRP